jgi:hypothetical protein
LSDLAPGPRSALFVHCSYSPSLGYFEILRRLAGPSVGVTAQVGLPSRPQITTAMVGPLMNIGAEGAHAPARTCQTRAEIS